MAKATQEWVKVAQAEELAEGQIKVVEPARNTLVALMRVEGQVYAVDDTCPHEHYSLGEEGVLEGHTLTCGGHGWEFDIRTGACKFPAIGIPVGTYEVKEEGGAIWVRLPGGGE